MSQDSKQTTSQQLDPTTQYLQRLVIGSGLGALGLGGMPEQSKTLSLPGGLHLTVPTAPGITPFGPKLQPIPGVDPLTTQAIGGFQQAANAGTLGLNALSGDQGAINTLMNPFQQDVLNQVKSQYGDLANLATNNVNDQATAAGAFGGTRHGVAEGVALGQLNKDMGNQLAGLQYQGYTDALGRAGQLANLGMGANDALNQLGEYQRQVAMQQDPAMRQLQILQGLLAGNPIAMSQTTTQHGSLLNGILGLGATAAGLGFNPFGKKSGG